MEETKNDREDLRDESQDAPQDEVQDDGASAGDEGVVEDDADKTVLLTDQAPTIPYAADAEPAAETADSDDRTRVVPRFTEGTTYLPHVVDREPASVESDRAIEITMLARQVTGLKRAVIALACTCLVLLAAVGVLAAGVFGAPQVPEVTPEEELASEPEDDEQVVASQAGSSTDDKDAQDAETSTSDEPLRAADIVYIVGEKWSNAQRMLDAHGVDQSNLVLVTDDGGAVFDATNWTVQLVSDLDAEGKIAVHLKHDTEMFWDKLFG